jgi:hypothetical protein
MKTTFAAMDFFLTYLSLGSAKARSLTVVSGKGDHSDIVQDPAYEISELDFTLALRASIVTSYDNSDVLATCFS